MKLLYQDTYFKAHSCFGKSSNIVVLDSFVNFLCPCSSPWLYRDPLNHKVYIYKFKIDIVNYQPDPELLLSRYGYALDAARREWIVASAFLPPPSPPLPPSAPTGICISRSSLSVKWSRGDEISQGIWFHMDMRLLTTLWCELKKQIIIIICFFRMAT